MKTRKKNIYFMNIILILAATLLSEGVFAQIELNSINFDPAIIAAGDEVDVVVQFHVTTQLENEDRIGNPDFAFKVRLASDDTISKEYVIITDADGDDVQGSVFSGDFYNRKFRVKIRNDAPAGNYEFKLEGRWYKNGIAEDSAQYVRFKMPVKKEGIILDINTLETVPAEVRAGDDYVKIIARIENVGQKDAKSVEVTLNLPEGISSSYTNNNRVWIGRVNAGESKEATFFVDVDEHLDSEELSITYMFKYLDLDDNSYNFLRRLPFLVKPRPYLEVVSSKGEGLAGEKSKLYVTVKNTGEESAESVDVRIIKQNSQPFVLDVRSDYIGELEPGEEGVAVFDIKVNGDAEIKEHDLKLLIRSKGDSDEGDDNIYTYNRRASFSVTGESPNFLLSFGLAGGAMALFGVAGVKIWRRKK